MNYSTACKNYIELRNKVNEIENKAKADAAEHKEKMLQLETWLTMKADEEGLDNIKTEFGTAYWSNIASAKVANRDAFMDFVKRENAFDMLENRVSKEAVKSYMAGHDNMVPPGVDFSQIRKFNLRATGGADSD
jgi:hypothetical protein